MLRARLSCSWPAADAHSTTAAGGRGARARSEDGPAAYNFPENQISDHRIGLEACDLDQVLNGRDLGPWESPQQAEHRRAAGVGGEPARSASPSAGSCPPRPPATSPRARVVESRPGRRICCCFVSGIVCRLPLLAELDDDGRVRRFSIVAGRTSTLQHLTGRPTTAGFLEVGPSVSCPTPETEVR